LVFEIRFFGHTFQRFEKREKAKSFFLIVLWVSDIELIDAD